MDSASAIASSALYGAAMKQVVAANNIANASTPDFQAATVQSSENRGGGVRTTVSQGSDSVSISKEAVNMLNNDNAFKANIKTLQTTDQMTQQLFSIMG